MVDLKEIIKQLRGFHYPHLHHHQLEMRNFNKNILARVSWLSFKTSLQSPEEKESQVDEAESLHFSTATFD